MNSSRNTEELILLRRENKELREALSIAHAQLDQAQALILQAEYREILRDSEDGEAQLRKVILRKPH